MSADRLPVGSQVVRINNSTAKGNFGNGGVALNLSS